MGPQNPQVYDFPMAEDEAGAKGKKKRERKKPTTKESKAAKSPKTPKAAKGKNVAGQVFSGKLYFCVSRIQKHRISRKRMKITFVHVVKVISNELLKLAFKI